MFIFKESQFYKATNRHYEEILKQVKLWLESLDERLFLEGKRQKILDEMKGKEPEKKLIPLINSNATEKLRKKDPKNYQDKLDSHLCQAQ